MHEPADKKMVDKKGEGHLCTLFTKAIKRNPIKYAILIEIILVARFVPYLMPGTLLHVKHNLVPFGMPSRQTTSSFEEKNPVIRSSQTEYKFFVGISALSVKPHHN